MCHVSTHTGCGAEEEEEEEEGRVVPTTGLAIEHGA